MNWKRVLSLGGIVHGRTGNTWHRCQKRGAWSEPLPAIEAGSAIGLSIDETLLSMSNALDRFYNFHILTTSGQETRVTVDQLTALMKV